MSFIDLNSDVGEGFGIWSGGPDRGLMQQMSSVNVACGFHAGDPAGLLDTCRLAVELGCVVGAQVGYPDLVGFGRRFLDMSPRDLEAAVVYQIGALDALARASGTMVRYVKPHGALYNAIVRHESQAVAVATAVASLDRALPILGLPGSAIEAACGSHGLRFVAEGFADRRYSADGRLVPRTEPGALITEPGAAAAQATRLVARGVESICVHSDTPGAIDITSAVVSALEAAGIQLRPFVS